MKRRVADRLPTVNRVDPQPPKADDNSGVPPEEVLRARNRFVAWLRWNIAMRPEIAPTPAALARKLGINKSALKRLMDPGSTVTPELRTLLAAEKLTGFPAHVLLHSDPPDIPARSR